MEGSLYYTPVRGPFSEHFSSLQKLTLGVVSTNFQIFMNEYKSPYSRIPKFYFQFLQSQYSTELFNDMLESGNLRMEFLEFLMNRHLREVNLKVIPPEMEYQSGWSTLKAIKEKILDIRQHITSFSLMGAFMMCQFYPVIPHLSCLEKLEIEYTNCRDEAIEIIANSCPFLKELDLYASCVTDEGMKYLCFPSKGHKLQLQSLIVARTDVKDGGILMILKHMPFINVVSHENLSSIIANGAAKNEFQENKFLNLNYIEVHNAKKEIQAISELCPNVKQLFVKNIDDQDHVMHCCKFRKLEEVNLTSVSRKDFSVHANNFLKMSGFFITTLSLENFVMSVDVLISSCPNLQRLELFDPIFDEPPDFASDKKLEKLVHFKIYGSSLLSKEDIMSPAHIISSSPQLVSLALHVCHIGFYMEDFILNCQIPLLHLDFSESLVTFEFISEVLIKYKELHYLTIGNSGINFNHYSALIAQVTVTNHPVKMLWY